MWRLLILIGLASLSFPFTASPQTAAPEATARPRYKSPLGLAVDEKGNGRT